MVGGNTSQIIVCSVMVKPARALIFYTMRTWIDQIVRIVVHTYAVDGNSIPLDIATPSGYWYCAGDFCDIDEAGVTQAIVYADIEYAKCLVSPDIKDDHEDRPEKVILGTYGVNYVCHNITNRVLYASEKQCTLVDLDIPITGYALVVKSTLGVYGQNKAEWHRKRLQCGGYPVDDGLLSSTIGPSDSDDSINNTISFRSREEEIHRLHLRAAGGDAEKAYRLTDALKNVDINYLNVTEDLVSSHKSDTMDVETFNSLMANATYELFSNTIEIVGGDMTQRIYPGCEITRLTPTENTFVQVAVPAKQTVEQ